MIWLWIGFNAFVLKYRTGQGGRIATEDLAAAMRYIFRNAGELGVTTVGYSLWGSSAGFETLLDAAEFASDGDLFRDKLLGLPATIAADVPDAELNAFLAADHATSETLREALVALAESLESLRANNNWNIRRAVSQRVGPVLGMVEARAILLRAKLLKDKPATLEALQAWLAEHQPQIDLRARLGAQPNDVYARFSDTRKQHGIPEVVHKGLALDAARLLARAGAFSDAARLLWFNRDAILGIESTQRMLALAATFADKAGDTTLANRCRVSGAGESPNPMGVESLNMPLMIAELPDTRADLEEFDGDLLNYLENQVIPWADSAMMQKLYARVPALAQARPTLMMRNSSRAGTEGIFASSVSSASCVVIWRNWSKMMVSSDTWENCHRFAGWVIASDLPLSYSTTYHNGLATTQDTAMGWGMLNELWKQQGANNPKALKATDRMQKLLDRTAAQPGQRFNLYSQWWM